MSFLQGNCDLLKFWGGFFEGVGYIHPGFKGAIININRYAQQCRIKVCLLELFYKKKLSLTRPRYGKAK